jgi:hypothetical protein
MNVRSLCLLAPLLLSLPCAAQQVQRAPAAEPTVGIDDYVVVQGWRHPVQLRMAMVDAELAVYDLFNKLNDDASLTLECRKRNIGSTRLQTTDCAPRFEADALQQEGQNLAESFRAQLNGMAMTEGNFAAGTYAEGFDASIFTSYSPTASGMPAPLAIKAGQTRLKSKMDELAATHPEFVEAVVHYVEAKKRYTESLVRAD